jgi:hypothetical protein
MAEDYARISAEESYRSHREVRLATKRAVMSRTICRGVQLRTAGSSKPLPNLAPGFVTVTEPSPGRVRPHWLHSTTGPAIRTTDRAGSAVALEFCT